MINLSDIPVNLFFSKLILIALKCIKEKIWYKWLIFDTSFCLKILFSYSIFLFVGFICSVLQVVRAPRTKHCRLCEQCFENMDHHCLFLLICLAKKNHALFCWFIICCLVSMTLFLVHCALYISRAYSDLTYSNTFYTMLWTDCWVLSLIAMNAASILWGVNLLRFQFSVVSRGMTTVFNSRTKTALTQQERLINILYFLIGREPFAEDPLICSQNTHTV